MDNGGLTWSTITDPFRNFVSIIFAYLPRILALILLFIAFWMIARVLRWAVRKALTAAKVDERLSQQNLVKSPQNRPVANGVATAVFWLFWIFFIPIMIGILNLQGILGPVESMFEKILEALPNIFAAVIVLVIAFVLAGLLARAAEALLVRAGFNRVLVTLGLAKAEPVEGQLTPARVVRYAIMVAVVLIGILAAAQLLRFESFTVLMGGLITFLAQVLWGTIVIGVGIFLALLVGRAIRVSSRPSASVLAMMAQVAIMVFAVAMGLRAMGFANQVVIIGFGAIVGAVAVAFAIAFGLGGRDTAGRELDSWIKNLRSGGSSNT